MASTATVLTAVAGFVVTTILGILLIPILRRLKYGQTIREDGPAWHAHKQGIPTMGGIMIVGGVIIAVVIGYLSAASFDGELLVASKDTTRLILGVALALAFGLIGFLDDYIKVVKKQNLGLRAKQKIVLQVLVTAAFLTALYLLGDTSTIVNIPFLGQWQMGILYYPIMGILIIGIVNSANLTDGIDGLLGSVTFIIAIFFMIASAVMHIRGMNILSTALAASCVGFLIFNAHPAKIFMGDTGSFFLGGLVVALAFGIDMPFILFFVAFIYCIESLSVILQVISFKTTGKRIFKMSPIHHHFEMSGMKETKIVTMFSIITVLMCGLAYLAVIQV